MKNLLLLIALFLSLHVTAQKTIVHVGVDAIGVSGDLPDEGATTALTIGLESRLSKRFTLGFDASLGSKNLLSVNDFKLKQNLNALKTGVRFYPKAANQSFFIGANLAYTNIAFKLKGDDIGGEDFKIYANGVSFTGIGLDIGFKTQINSRLSLGTQFGVNLMASSGGTEALQYNLGAKIGYKFLG